MALSTFFGSIAQKTTTGSQAYTGVGFQPSVLIFFFNDQTAEADALHLCCGLGVAAGASAERAVANFGSDGGIDSVVAQRNASCLRLDNGLGAVAEADLTSFDSDGFTLNWATTDGTARLIAFLALGGSDLSNVACGSNAIPTTAVDDAITGLGFEPDLVIVFSAYTDTTTDPNASLLANGSRLIGWGADGDSTGAGGAGGYFMHGGHATSARHRKYALATKIYASLSQGTLQGEASLKSMDSDGFTMNFSTAGSTARQHYWLALKGTFQKKTGAETQKTSTGTKATTGAGFQPTIAIFSARNAVAGTTIISHMENSFGMAQSSSARGCIWAGGEENGSAGTRFRDQSLRTTKCILMRTEAGGTPSTNAEADLTTLDSDGFTVNWTTADATAREFYYLLLGSSAAAAQTVDMWHPRIEQQYPFQKEMVNY